MVDLYCRFKYHCVRDESAKDQLVVGGKMTGITESILPNNPSTRAEKINWPRLAFLPLLLLIPSRGPPMPTGRLEVTIHIQQSRGFQNIGYLHIHIHLNKVKVEIEIYH